MQGPFWYNYVTDEYSQEPPTTDEIAKQYLPQDMAVQCIYSCYRELGNGILESIVKTLNHVIGKAEEASPSLD